VPHPCSRMRGFPRQRCHPLCANRRGADPAYGVHPRRFILPGLGFHPSDKRLGARFVRGLDRWRRQRCVEIHRPRGKDGDTGVQPRSLMSGGPTASLPPSRGRRFCSSYSASEQNRLTPWRDDGEFGAAAREKTGALSSSPTRPNLMMKPGPGPPPNPLTNRQRKNARSQDRRCEQIPGIWCQRDADGCQIRREWFGRFRRHKAGPENTTVKMDGVLKYDRAPKAVSKILSQTSDLESRRGPRKRSSSCVRNPGLECGGYSISPAASDSTQNTTCSSRRLDEFRSLDD